jgi:hypothetical protein
MVTEALPICVASASEVAVTVTKAGFGAAAGAVYNPSGVIIPQEMPLQPAPEMPQITMPSAEPVALNCSWPPTFT